MESLPTDHLIFEVAADRAGLGQQARVLGQMRRVRGETAFEIDGNRQFDRTNDTPDAIEKQRERNALPVGKAVRFGQAMTAGGNGLRPGCGDRLRAAHVPDVVKEDRVARLVESGEAIAIFLVHGRVLPEEPVRHCEERSDEAIQSAAQYALDCFATLAMTRPVNVWYLALLLPFEQLLLDIEPVGITAQRTVGTHDAVT